MQFLSEVWTRGGPTYRSVAGGAMNDMNSVVPSKIAPEGHARAPSPASIGIGLFAPRA